MVSFAAHAGVLPQIENWNAFDVFQVANFSKGLPLEVVTLALFAQHDLLDKLKIPYDRLRNFVRVRGPGQSSEDFALKAILQQRVLSASSIQHVP